MKFFDRDFLKFTFQFMVMISFGILVISYASGLNSDTEVIAGVVDGQ